MAKTAQSTKVLPEVTVTAANQGDYGPLADFLASEAEEGFTFRLLGRELTEVEWDLGTATRTKDSWQIIWGKGHEDSYVDKDDNEDCIIKYWNWGP